MTGNTLRVVPGEENRTFRNSYLMKLGDRLTWRLVGDDGTVEWLNRLAALLELESGDCEKACTVRFVRKQPRGLWGRLLRHAPSPPIVDGLPQSGWKHGHLGPVMMWWHADVSDVLCEIGHGVSDDLEIISMWRSLHALYRGVLESGGLPLHAALLCRGNEGVVVVAGGGVGKTTCCRNVVPPWTARADDAVVIVPSGCGGYVAHPFPTWSEYFFHGSNRTWDVQRGVALKALFFLEQGTNDEVLPVGQGEAALRLNHFSAYISRIGWVRPDPCDQALRLKTLFDNCCGVARCVPAFNLRAKLGSGFLNEIGKVMK